LSASAFATDFTYEQMARYIEVIGYYCKVVTEEILSKLYECGWHFHHKSKLLT
jgi:hypothetical protein